MSFSPIFTRYPYRHPSHSPMSRNTLQTTTPVLLRRSSRESKWPSQLKDFFCNNIFLTNLISCFVDPVVSNVCSFEILSSHNQHVLQSISQISKPTSFTQASTHPGWQEAMNSEIEALKSNHTWDVVVLPPGKKALPCK